jgi:hypothetical protein
VNTPSWPVRKIMIVTSSHTSRKKNWKYGHIFFLEAKSRSKDVLFRSVILSALLLSR